MGAGGERCVSRPHIGPICHCCLLDPALHFSAMILLPFFVPDAATQSPSPFWIVISLPPSLHALSSTELMNESFSRANEEIRFWARRCFV